MPPLLLLLLAAPAADPLHAKIDAVIDARAADEKHPLSPPADDAEFVRRVWLDLAGRIPTATEARTFLDDRSADKRTRLIDALLAGPDYPTAMADRFHLMLMERLGDHAGWHAFLRESFAANRPWDRTVAEMLRADSSGGSGFFLSKRLENYGQNPVDHSALTRDVGRLFLGKDLRCAECHDHLFIDGYKQRDFQGLHAFFKNAVLVNATTAEVGEKPTTEKTKFASVFTKVEMVTAPALPGGEMVEVPAFPKGQEFAVPPGKGQKVGVPKFRTLAAAADRLPTAANRDFVRNTVNRVWFLFLGRGLVHPLDLHHAGNPPSHPAALDLLADEFVASRFDLKRLTREIVLTRAYQRSSVLPDGSTGADDKLFATALERRLAAEQLAASVATATGEPIPAAARGKFVKAFGNQPREPELEPEPSLKGALFVLHDDAVLALLKPKPGNLVGRLAEIEDSAKLADELYLSVLSRRPSAEEAKTVADVLGRSSGQRAGAVGKLAWSLLASMEFGVNH